MSAGQMLRLSLRVIGISATRYLCLALEVGVQSVPSESRGTKGSGRRENRAEHENFWQVVYLSTLGAPISQGRCLHFVTFARGT